MVNTYLIIAALSFLISGISAIALGSSPPLPPQTSVTFLGRATSTEPNIFRDGGGGGKVNGLDFIIFSDGIYTKDGTIPTDNSSNWVNFTSNSIACSNYEGKGITSLTDFGTAEKGPRQQIPYFYNHGEDDNNNGVWPNQGIVTLCGGSCGVSFPVVLDRNLIRNGSNGNLYNTGINITLTGDSPTVVRPTQALFKAGEPLFGTFGTLAGIDGYLYMFASITNTTTSNGLKMARAPQTSWSDRTQYQFWSGSAWTSRIPAYNDGGRSNILSWSEDEFGSQYGPGTGDLFYSPHYDQYLVFFQSDAAALDSNVYLSYSSTLEKGWSVPKVIYTIPPVSDGYSYSFHAYANYDPTGHVIPISWAQWSSTDSYHIAMANVTFA